MNIVLYTDNIDEYLKEDNVINYGNENIMQLAFPIRTEKGEEDGFVIYPDPDKKVLEKFKNYKTRTELWDDLPSELGYNS